MFLAAGPHVLMLTGSRAPGVQGEYRGRPWAPGQSWGKRVSDLGLRDSSDVVMGGWLRKGWGVAHLSGPRPCGVPTVLGPTAGAGRAAVMQGSCPTWARLPAGTGGLRPRQGLCSMPGWLWGREGAWALAVGGPMA